MDKYQGLQYGAEKWQYGEGGIERRRSARLRSSLRTPRFSALVSACRRILAALRHRGTPAFAGRSRFQVFAKAFLADRLLGFNTDPASAGEGPFP